MHAKISDLKIERVKPENGLIAFCSFILNNQIGFRGVAIFHRLEGGIRLSWPEKQVGIKKMKSAAPINKETADEIEAQVFQALELENKNNAFNDNNY